jgi:UDP-GlcNAc:undecaprenyl-phosphate GlcNAc-1-phosphate transferase
LGDFFSNESLTSIKDHVLPGVWPLLVAFVLCAVVVPVMIYVSRKTGMMAMPSERHPHSKPTPLLGGIAMYIGFAVAVIAFLPFNSETVGVLVVSGLATVLLVADDRWAVRPLIKLAMQLGLALLVVVGFGSPFVITFFGLPGGHIVQFGLLVGVPLSVFWLVGMQNTVNFLDGVDGLAAGVILIVSLTLMLAAAGTEPVDVVRLAGALAGACAGFLIFNFHPARIFMGDSGAHFLGITLGVLSILGVAKVAVAFALAVPALALALPIADTAWAILRRRRVKVSVAKPDLEHLHHRLQAFGLDQRETCYVFYAASAVLGAVGLTLFGHGRILAVSLVLAFILASTVAADLLQKTGWRVPAPYLRSLLADRRTR